MLCRPCQLNPVYLLLVKQQNVVHHINITGRYNFSTNYTGTPIGWRHSERVWRHSLSHCHVDPVGQLERNLPHQITGGPELRLIHYASWSHIGNYCLFLCQCWIVNLWPHCNRIYMDNSNCSALRNYRMTAVIIIVLLYCCKEGEQNRQSEGEALTIASVSTTMYLN